MKNTTKTVDEISEINFTGNIIPPIWFQTIRYKNKRGTFPHLLAISILSDIIYWYNAGDELIRSYNTFAERFGVSYKMAREACLFLKDLGLVTIEFRSIKTEYGNMLQNVMFIQPCVVEIERYTYPPEDKA
jgi:hypothetical protein